jgi:hypothetical protein
MTAKNMQKLDFQHMALSCRCSDICIATTGIITFFTNTSSLTMWYFMSFVVCHHARHKTIVPSSIIWSPCRSYVILHITLGISANKTCRVCLLNHDWAMHWHHVFTLSSPKATKNPPITLSKTYNTSFGICALSIEAPLQYVCALSNFLWWVTQIKYQCKFTFLQLCLACQLVTCNYLRAYSSIYSSKINFNSPSKTCQLSLSSEHMPHKCMMKCKTLWKLV